MDLPQEWMTREDMAAALGDDEDIDALNDETFGDGGWDAVDPMNAGDIADLSSMTFGSADILKEASLAASGVIQQDEYPALPTNAPMLGSGLLRPGDLITPQMLLSKQAPAIPKAEQQHSHLAPVQHAAQQPEWQTAPGISSHFATSGASGAFGHQVDSMAHPPAQPPLMLHQAAGVDGLKHHQQATAGRAMSVAEIEAQLLSGASQAQKMPPPQQQVQPQQLQSQPPGIQQPVGHMPHGMIPGMGQQHPMQQMGHAGPHAGMNPALQQIQALQMQALLQRHHHLMQQQQQQQQGNFTQPLSEIMQEQAHERSKGRPQQAFNFAPSPNTRSDVGRQSWTRMTAEEVNQILRLQNSMLRDAAATNVYHSMLLAKQGTRANFVGPKIEGRSIKLSEALEGALGKPAPHDLRRPRQIVQIFSKSKEEEASHEQANGVTRKGGDTNSADATDEHLNVPAVISKLPRAVRISVENGMIRLLNVQDIDKIPIPDPTTVQRRATQVHELYELCHINVMRGERHSTINADMSSLNECKFEGDKFFAQLVLVPKGCKLLLRSMPLLNDPQRAEMLDHILRCLLPIGYQSETHKEATGIELLVQLLVKLVYSLGFLQLEAVLRHFMESYSDGGLHLLICTKLGALALAALLRRGHDEYMADESLRSPEQRKNLLYWAATCQALISRCQGGLEPLFNAATQGGISALPKHMIVDAEVMVDFLYELGANANPDQRSAICTELASIAGKKADQQVKEQVAQLLESLQWAQ